MIKKKITYLVIGESPISGIFKSQLYEPYGHLGEVFQIKILFLVNPYLWLKNREEISILRGSLKDIEIVIHPESLVHAIIQLKNGLYKFLYHETTMLIPLANAIFEENFDVKKLLKNNVTKKDFFFKSLSFQKVEKKRFPVIKLKSMMNDFHSTPIIINAVNEILVDQYLKKKIPFNSFYDYILSVMKDRNYKKYAIKEPKNINQILIIDEWAREVTFQKIKNNNA